MQILRAPLRRINEALRFSFPPKMCRERGLRAGDYVYLFEDENGDIKLKFLKVPPPVYPPAELAETA
jgi:hypothetical protein